MWDFLGDLFSSSSSSSDLTSGFFDLSGSGSSLTSGLAGSAWDFMGSDTGIGDLFGFGSSIGDYGGAAADAASSSFNFSDALKYAGPIMSGISGMQGLSRAEEMRKQAQRSDPWGASGGRGLADQQLQAFMRDPMQAAAQDPSYKMRIQGAQRANAQYGQDSGAMSVAGANASTDWYNQRLASLGGLAGTNSNPGAPMQGLEAAAGLQSQGLASIGYGVTSATGGQTPQQMLQGMGQNGDSILAHINPEEAQLLKARGGVGTRNPQTGLMQFYEAEDGMNFGAAEIGGGPDVGMGGGFNSGNLGGGFGGMGDIGEGFGGLSRGDGGPNGEMSLEEQYATYGTGRTAAELLAGYGAGASQNYLGKFANLWTNLNPAARFMAGMAIPGIGTVGAVSKMLNGAGFGTNTGGAQGTNPSAFGASYNNQRERDGGGFNPRLFEGAMYA